MAGQFDLYNVVIIDSSLFPRTLSDELINGLKSVRNIYVSGTFRAEILELMELLSPADKANCERNLKLLNTVIHPKELNLSDFPNMNCDVWDFLALSATRPHADKMLFITANMVLIQRVICSHMPMDIYNLNKSVFLSHTAYPFIDKNYAIDNNDKPVSETVCDNIDEGSALYVVRRSGKTNETVTLGKMLGDGAGGEGNVYHLTGKYQNEVGKIFKTGQFPNNKYRVTTEMVKNPRFEAIAWTEFPTGILYADAECLQPVGIMERFTETQSSLYDDELFFGDTGIWTSALLSVRVSDLLYLCLCITRQICYLNMLGVLVADYNIKNFDYPISLRKRSGSSLQNPVCQYIQMWDSDSFGYNNYFSGYMADISCRKYDITQRLDILNLCNDELYSFLFQILTLGDNPYNPVTGRFNYEDSNYCEYARREFIPAPIWNAFERFFTGKSTSSPPMMLHLLHNELNRRAASPEIDITYRDIVNRIDAGFLEEQDRKVAAVYSPARNIFPRGNRAVQAPAVKPVPPPRRQINPQTPPNIKRVPYTIPPAKSSPTVPPWTPPNQTPPNQTPPNPLPPNNLRSTGYPLPQAENPEPEKKKKKLGWLIGGISAGVVLLIILLFFFI